MGEVRQSSAPGSGAQRTRQGCWTSPPSPQQRGQQGGRSLGDKTEAGWGSLRVPSPARMGAMNPQDPGEGGTEILKRTKYLLVWRYSYLGVRNEAVENKIIYIKLHSSPGIVDRAHYILCFVTGPWDSGLSGIRVLGGIVSLRRGALCVSLRYLWAS